MDAYTTFAQVYDLFMDNVPYEEWSEYLLSVLKEYGIHSGVICDLGCGTGKMTRLLAQAGYDMIGVDLSEDMLAIASRTRMKREYSIFVRICVNWNCMERQKQWCPYVTASTIC